MRRTPAVDHLGRTLLQRRLAERRSRSRARDGTVAAVAAAVAHHRRARPPSSAAGSPRSGPRRPMPRSRCRRPRPPDRLRRCDRPPASAAFGPADAPLDPTSTAAPGASPAPVEIGRLKVTGPFVIGVACLGHGEMRVEVRTPQFDFPYPGCRAVRRKAGLVRVPRGTDRPERRGGHRVRDRRSEAHRGAWRSGRTRPTSRRRRTSHPSS